MSVNIKRSINKMRAVYQKEGAPKIIIYDIETTLLGAYVFGLGKQVVRHNQLIPGQSRWGIICINYVWLHSGEVQSIRWNPETGLSGLIKEFDAVVKEADWIIGKNSDRFDNKMVTAARMFTGLPGMPEWTKYTDDLERQMRRYFRLPSQSLDYMSYQLGLGGKDKMDFGDWVDIQQWMEVEELLFQGVDLVQLNLMTLHRYNKNANQIKKDGTVAFEKMCTYGMKDVSDTEALWFFLSEHFEPKFNMATFKNEKLACKHCGSTNLVQNHRGYKVSGKTRYKEFKCRDCRRYAGRSTVSDIKEKVGRIG